MNDRKYTISNIAGGDRREFCLTRDGELTDAALRYARRIGFGGPAFDGPAGGRAAELLQELEEAET